MSGIRGAPKGNRNAAKSKPWEQALKLALSRAGGDIQKGLSTIADHVVKAAQGGDMSAISELANRLDGKPAQSIDVTGDLTVRDAAELSDAELAVIASGSSAGVAEATDSETELTGVH